MKNYLLIFSVLSVWMGCTGEVKDKKAELDALKKEQAALKEKINLLESAIALEDTTEDKSKLVGVTEMQPITFNHFIEVQATVEGDDDLLLSPETSGTVESIFVKAGDKVERGKILAIIDDKIIRESINELQSQLELATQLYNRQKNLWDQKIGSEIQFLQAKTNKESLDKRMSLLQEQLNMTRIVSPINGTVDNVIIKVGQTVAPGMPGIRVLNFSSLKVRGEIAESFINRVDKGDDVILYFPDQKKEVKTKIDYSGNRIDPMNRTFNVEVRLKENNNVFLPNMICVMKIIDYSNSSAFVVPVGAIQKSSDGEFIYVAVKENNKLIAKRKIVESGMSYNGFTEILKGLAPGDKVITNGFQNVIEGDEVAI